MPAVGSVRFGPRVDGSELARTLLHESRHWSVQSACSACLRFCDDRWP